MKAQYRYSEPFGDILAIVTGKSAARGRDSVHNLRRERTRYLERIADLNKNVKNLRRANAVMRNHARKEGERMLADIKRLNDELEEVCKDSDIALQVANRDKQALLDEVEALTEENHNLCDEITRLQEAYESVQKETEQAKYDCWFSMLCSEIARLNDELANEQSYASHGWTLAYQNAKLSDKLSDRLHACRIDRRKWRDFANRCFMASLKNAVALADERKGKRGA